MDFHRHVAPDGVFNPPLRWLGFSTQVVSCRRATYDLEDVATGLWPVSRRTATRLHHPFRPSLFVERGDAFTRFARFAGLHVIIERKIDIFSHRTPPEFFY